MFKNILIIAILVLIVTAPFLNKPFHIDEPLFIYSARSILSNPLMPYSFYFSRFNTLGFAFEEFSNPPLIPYFLALIIRFFGERENTIHLFFMFFSIFAAYSVFLLSKKFTKNCLLATLMVIASPIFMLSSHSIMPDMALLSFFTFSVYLFISGFDDKDDRLLFLSGVFIGLTTMIRYSGALLIPLLFIYAILKSHKLDRRTLYLLIPLFMFALWCLHNVFFYKGIHIIKVLEFSKRFAYMSNSNFFSKVIFNLIYFGSLMLFPAVFSLWFLYKNNKSRYLWLLFILFIASLFYLNSFNEYNFNHRFIDIVLFSLFLTLTMIFIMLLFIELILKQIKKKNFSEEFRKDLFLFIWLAIVVSFHSYAYFIAPKFTLLNLLPLSLLLFRLLERDFSDFTGFAKITIIVSLILGVFLSLSDYEQAFIHSRAGKIRDELAEENKAFIWTNDLDMDKGYYVSDQFKPAFQHHDLKENDLVLGTPFFYSADILQRGYGITAISSIAIRLPFINVVDFYNGVFLYSGSWGNNRLFPYSFSKRVGPTFILWRIVSNENSKQ